MIDSVERWQQLRYERPFQTRRRRSQGYRPLPAAEALTREMAQRQEWAQRPDSIEWEQLQVWEREQSEREKAARRQRPAEMIGPYRLKLRP